jgi:hypothetical protein
MERNGNNIGDTFVRNLLSIYIENEIKTRFRKSKKQLVYKFIKCQRRL